MVKVVVGRSMQRVSIFRDVQVIIMFIIKLSQSRDPPSASNQFSPKSPSPNENASHHPNLNTLKAIKKTTHHHHFKNNILTITHQNKNTNLCNIVSNEIKAYLTWKGCKRQRSLSSLRRSRRKSRKGSRKKRRIR